MTNNIKLKDRKLSLVKNYYGDDDYETERLGFEHEGFFITEPDTSECGRFIFSIDDACKYYGITKKQFRMIMKFNQIHDLSGDKMPDTYVS